MICKIFENGKLTIVNRTYDFSSRDSFKTLPPIDTVLEVRNEPTPKIAFHPRNPRAGHTYPRDFAPADEIGDLG